MIIEKTVIEGNRYNVDLNDYVAEGELTVQRPHREIC